MCVWEGKNYEEGGENQEMESQMIFIPHQILSMDRVAQSVQRLTTGWTVRGSNPDGAGFFRPSRPALGAHPASCTIVTGSFPGVKSGRGVTLTPHRLLVPRSWKSRAIPLPTLWGTTGPVTGTLYLFLPNIIWVMKPSMRGAEDTCFQEFGFKIFNEPTIQVRAAVNTIMKFRVA